MKPLLEEKSGTHWDAPVVLLAGAIFAWLWLWQVRDSTGFLEADACTHYQIARYAFQEPFRFADVWGRPFKTLMYCVPAYFGGRLGVQSMSLVLAVSIAFCAMLIAGRAGMRRPAIAFIFTLAQPLLFLHAFSELTELPFAMLLAVVALAVLAGWWRAAALLGGFLPLARPEGFAFLGVLALGMAGALVWRRNEVRRNAAATNAGPDQPSRFAAIPWGAIGLLPVGLILWSVFGWWSNGMIGSPHDWISRHWPYASDSIYTAGKNDSVRRLFRFAAALPGVTSPLIFPGLILGFGVAGAAGWRWLREMRQSSGRSRQREAQAIVLFAAGSIFLGHSVLYALGKMATNGELRYMLVVAPFWGVLCALGWERGFELLKRPAAEALRFAAYATPLPLILNTHVYRVLPIRFESAGETARFVAAWADEYGRSHGRPRIMAADPAIYYFLNRSNIDRERSVEFTVANVKAAPPGTMLLYDPIYCRFNSDMARTVTGTEPITEAGWQEVPFFTIGGWRLFVSPQPAVGSVGKRTELPVPR